MTDINTYLTKYCSRY